MRVTLLCWLSCCLLELWIYLSAFSDPFKDTGHLVWEGPASLLLLITGVIFGWRYLWVEKHHRRLAIVLAVVLAGMVAAPFVPISSSPNSDWRVEVYKSARRLDLYHDGNLVDSYKVALSSHGDQGDKEVMSDGKTPEGRFIICDKAPSQFHKWLGLNYPTPEDAWRGRRQARITWAEYWYILVENRNGRVPFGNSALGGAIGIHGGGSGKDWTLGCVALDNSDIDEFFDDLPLGTEVYVRP